jgi:FKBP-type peptidyl-prolyl cis-trans isomerase 2
MLLILLLGNTRCATHSAPGSDAGLGPVIIQPGDTADVSFMCRLKNGEIVAATDKEKLQGMTISRAFWPIKKEGPASITAAVPGVPDAKERSFGEEITAQLASKVSGMKEGEGRTFELTAQDMPERDPQSYITTTPRVRFRPKEMRMPVSEYEHRVNKVAEVGQTFIIDPAFPGQVVSVTDKEVVIHFQGKVGSVIETPFGPGHISEDEKNYLVDIDAQKDSLVRSGPFVGLITAVDEQNMTINYLHPFGGETLTCDVTIEKVSKGKPFVSAAGK